MVTETVIIIPPPPPLEVHQTNKYERVDSTYFIPDSQNQLLLHGIREAYRVESSRQIPGIKDVDEVLIKIHAISLNPIDWKVP